MYESTWSVAPTVTETWYYGAATVGAAGAITLKTTVAGPFGVAYKIFFRSAGDSSARTWTIVGHKMGTNDGILTTEVVNAPNATTTASTGYYDFIVSITASGAMTGNQSVGVGDGASGTLTSIGLPDARIMGVYYVGAAAAGSIVVTRNSTTGTEILRVPTPAGVATTMYVNTGRIRVSGSNATTDWGLVTPTQVIFYTLFCG